MQEATTLISQLLATTRSCNNKMQESEATSSNQQQHHKRRRRRLPQATMKPYLCLRVLLLGLCSTLLLVEHTCFATTTSHHQIILASFLTPSQQINITHVTYDPIHDTVYLGATNNLYQLNGSDLSLQYEQPTGPLNDNPSCRITECQGYEELMKPTQTVNKILVIDYLHQKLLSCGSTKQGACRRHQLNNIAQQEDLIPEAVAANDDNSSTIAFIGPARYTFESANGIVQQQPQQVLYVASTYIKPRDLLVPAIGTRMLSDDPRSLLKLYENTVVDSARIDINSHLRDYFLVNYLYAFASSNYIYFVTVQKKATSRDYEELGYHTRLARICITDSSYNSYTEVDLKCKPNKNKISPGASKLFDSSSPAQPEEYPLLQDAILVDAGSHLLQSLQSNGQADQQSGFFTGNTNNPNSPGGPTIQEPSSADDSKVLLGVFTTAKDHTHHPGDHSALCAFSLTEIEEKFNDNIHNCYTGKMQSRNMEYIAGNVQECPKSGQGGNVVNFCLETLKINGSIAISSKASIQYSNTTLTAITATSHVNSHLKNIYLEQLTSDLAAFNVTLAAATYASITGSSPVSSSGASQQQQLQHTAVFMGTSNGHIKKVLLNNASNALEFEDLQVDTNPILADLHLHASGKQLIAATPYKIIKIPTYNCAQYSNCRECSQSRNPYCGWCSLKRSCTTKSECPSSGSGSSPVETQKSDANRVVGAQINNKQQLKWISSDSAGKCIDLVSIVPDKVPITSTGKIDLYIQRLPRLPKEHAYKCIFDRKEQTLATQTAYGLSCSLPKVMHRPKIQPGRDHALVDLTVRSSETNTDFLDGKITFFECQLHTTCKDCLTANWGCNWCLNENICLFNTSKCEKTGPQQARQLESILLPSAGQVQPQLIGGQRGAGNGALILQQQQQRSAGNTINQVSQCPTFDVGHQQDILIAAGTERELSIKVKNIPQFKGNVQCIVEVEITRTVLRGRIGEDRVICENSTYHYRADVGMLNGQLIVSYSDSNIFIDKTNFTLYKCHLLGSYLNRPDCSLCQRLNPALNCGWCGGSCQLKSQCSQRLDDTCPPPRIDFVSPLKGPINGGTRLTIEGSNLGQSYEEIVNRVSVGNVPCRPIQEEYRPSNKIVCIVDPLPQSPTKKPFLELDDVVSFGDITVGNKAGYTIGPSFQFKTIFLRDHQPKYGPQSGGTRITISGFNLNIGSSIQVFLDELACQVEAGSVTSEQLACITSASRQPSRTINQMKLIIDDAQVIREEDTFYYTQDPTINRIWPLKSYVSGGKPINVYGTNLTSVQHPRMAILDIATGKKLNESLCLLHDDSRMQCPSPAATNLPPPTTTTLELEQQQTGESTGAAGNREQQAGAIYAHSPQDEPLKFRVSFIMDNVAKLSDLQTYQPALNSEILYTADPKLYPFASDQYKALQAMDVQQMLARGQMVPNVDDQQQTFLIEPDIYLAEPLEPKLTLFGENLRLAVADYEVTISIGTDICNLTNISSNKLVCAIPLNHIAPPVDEEGRETQRALPLVVVRIGFNLRFEIGYMQYHPRLLEQIRQTSEQALQRPIYPNYMPRENESLLRKIAGFFSTVLMLAMYLLLAVVLITLVYRYGKCRQPNVISQVDCIEKSVKVECQLAFMSLQSDLSELVNHVELSGVPVLNTKRFIMKVFFPGINNHPLLRTSGIQYPLKTTVDPMEQFERLILKKPFLITFINTLEAQPSFTIRDKVNVASLIMIALMDRLDYATDILKTLLFQLVARSVSQDYSNTLRSLRASTCKRKKSALSKVVGGSASNLFNTTTSAAQLLLSRMSKKTSPIHQQQHQHTATYRRNISTTTFLENRVPTLSQKSQLQEMNIYSSERLMLRRTDTVVEKMLTNWLALNMYGHFHGEAGQSLYLLFEALRCQLERGPIEAQTGNAYYSLSESKLLREPYIQFNQVNLYVIVDTSIMQNNPRGCNNNNNQTLLIDSDTSPYYFDDLSGATQSRTANTITLSLRVIDCDTISQVKRKILNALYRNSAYSTRLSVDDVLLSLRQHQMIGGQCTMSSGAQYVTINLYDEDFTSVVAPNGIKRINTIRHYGVSEHAIMTLNRYNHPSKVCQSNTRTNLTEMLDEHYNNPYSEIQYGPLKQQHHQQFYHPSSSSTSSTGNVMDTHSTSADSSVNAAHLLTKSYTVKDEQPIYYQIGSTTNSNRSEPSTQQIYLTRMMMSKGTVQSYIDNFFKTILKHPEGSCGLPAIKWLFDLLDEAALENGIVDEEVVFSWKSNAFLLRFWANFIKNPNYILDVDKTNTLDASLSTIAQTLIDSCSLNDQKINMESSTHRLLFAKDVPRYRNLVKRFYQDISSVRPVNDHEMFNHIKSLFNGQQPSGLNFDKRLALKELCVYAANYGVDLMSSISSNFTCQQLDLANELEQCFRSFTPH